MRGEVRSWQSSAAGRLCNMLKTALGALPPSWRPPAQGTWRGEDWTAGPMHLKVTRQTRGWSKPSSVGDSVPPAPGVPVLGGPPRAFRPEGLAFWSLRVPVTRARQSTHPSILVVRGHVQPAFLPRLAAVKGTIRTRGAVSGEEPCRLPRPHVHALPPWL